jgi:hypothetical protein
VHQHDILGDGSVFGPNDSGHVGRDHASGKQSREQSTIEHEYLQFFWLLM